ncbi:MAG: hypothetical protein M1449_04245, partial [Candidatus Thermoplasmatota archaeon]|nr:hypothetical protein [Candidatus Thermoplasmatota archaeon]
LSAGRLPLTELDAIADSRVALRLSGLSGVAQVLVFGSQKYARHAGPRAGPRAGFSLRAGAGDRCITLQFELDRDIDAAAQDVQTAIAQAARKIGRA